MAGYFDPQRGWRPADLLVSFLRLRRLFTAIFLGARRSESGRERSTRRSGASDVLRGHR